MNTKSFFIQKFLYGYLGRRKIMYDVMEASCEKTHQHFMKINKIQKNHFQRILKRQYALHKIKVAAAKKKKAEADALKKKKGKGKKRSATMAKTQPTGALTALGKTGGTNNVTLGTGECLDISLGQGGDTMNTNEEGAEPQEGEEDENNNDDLEREGAIPEEGEEQENQDQDEENKA